MYLAFQVDVPLPRDTVYRFYRNPANILLLHSGWSNVRVLRHSGCVSDGAESWIEVTMGGLLPLVMGFRHENDQPPCRFTDQLFHGPFGRFLHVHEFEDAGGSTRVRDLLDVTLPWWLGGELATRLVVGPMLSDAFRQRATVLKRLASDGTLSRAAKSTIQTGDA